MTTCPSGVHYMHLVDHARAYIEETYRRPWLDRAAARAARPRPALSEPLPPRADGARCWPSRCRPLLGRVARASARGSAAMLDLAPAALPSRSPSDRPGVFPRRGRAARPRRDPVAAAPSRCCTRRINEATIRLLNRHGVEVVSPKGEGCCGALVHHMGRDDEAHGFARRNIDAWIAEIDGEGLDAIVITASGCGTTIKDYGFMFRDDPAYADKAQRVSALAKDITEYLATLELMPRRARHGPRGRLPLGLLDAARPADSRRSRRPC